MSEASLLIEALRKAADEPEARPAFYELLMKTTVFVPGLRREGQNGVSPQLRFKQWPQPEGFMAIPFFPDPEALKKVLGEEEIFLGLPALELFRLTRGTTLVLMGAGSLNKAFKPDEVDFILSSEMAMDPLAAALEKAVREESPEAKGAFYQALINSQVFVFGEPRTKEGEAIPHGFRPMSQDDKFSIATISHPHKPEDRIIPFFSSSELLQRAAKAASLPPQTTFLGFSALDLLKMAKGMGLPLVLNLGPMTYKIFKREEIEFILANAKPKQVERRELPAGSLSFLSPPADCPQELVGALLDFLPGLPNLKAAYLADRGGPPALVVGLETEEEADWAEILSQTKARLDGLALKDQELRYARVGPGPDGLGRSLLEKIKPFYRREPRGAAAEEPEAPAEKFFSHANEAGSRIFLAPAEDLEPTEILLDFLPGLPGVRAAYLAVLTEEPVLLLGLETEEDVELDSLFNQIAALVTRHIPGGRAVDFTLVRPDDENGLGRLLQKHINPFYRRALARETGAEAGAAAPPGGTPGFFSRLGRLIRVFKG